MARRSKFSMMFSASPTAVPPLDGVGMPYTSRPRYRLCVGAGNRAWYLATSAVVMPPGRIGDAQGPIGVGDSGGGGGGGGGGAGPRGGGAGAPPPPAARR